MGLEKGQQQVIEDRIGLLGVCFLDKEGLKAQWQVTTDNLDKAYAVNRVEKLLVPISVIELQAGTQLCLIERW